MTQTSKLDTAVLDSLAALAQDFDHEATHYDTFEAVEPVTRAAGSLRLVRAKVREGIFDSIEGYSWLHAGRGVLKATIYARENGITFEQAVEVLSA